MKRYLIPLIIVALLFSIVIGVLLWWRKNSKPVSNDTKTVDFLVVKGRGANQIGEALYDEGLIISPLAFKIYVQVSGKADQVQAGEFRISPSYSLTQVVDTLTKPPAELWVTIPEGLRREEIVERFIAGLEIEEAEGDVFRQEFLQASDKDEGYLFPDTYLFPRTASATLVVTKMRSTFEVKISEFEDDLKESTLKLNEIVTLASIIERETRTDEERPVVAGILLNRLEIGMSLQADATVQYAVANTKCQMLNAKCKDWWPIILKDDITINSPFNTYRFSGLPPAPIASPGISSLKAVVSPEETDYLYYLHDAEGGIHYAETLGGHNANIREYLGK